MTPPFLLIVDDDLEMAELIADIAQEVAIKPVIAPDAETAIELMEQHEFCGIFLDLVLPGKDGIDLVRRVNAFNNLIPIVIMSGFDGKYIDIASTFASGSGNLLLGTLMKPFTVSEATGFMLQMLDFRQDLQK